MSDKTTIYSLARELGMTPSMVSRALNPSCHVKKEKRQLVLETAARYGYSPNVTASRLSQGEITVGVILCTAADHVNRALICGINEAFEQRKHLKIKPDITVIPIDAPNEEKLRLCNETADRLLSDETVKGVILSGFSNRVLLPVMKRLRDSLPIVFLQDKLEHEKCLFASCHDERLAARVACELLAMSLRHRTDGHTKVLLFTGDGDIWLHRNAITAFTESCRQWGLDLIEAVDMHDSSEYLSSILDDKVGRNANCLGGIYITSGNSLPLCRYVEEHRLPLTLVTFDVYEELSRYIRNGTVQVTMCQNLKGQAKNAYLTLADYLISGTPMPDTVVSEVCPVMISNLDAYLPCPAPQDSEGSS